MPISQNKFVELCRLCGIKASNAKLRKLYKELVKLGFVRDGEKETKMV